MRLERMIQAVDLHAGGEPGRVIVGGVLDVPGATMFDKMSWLRENRDDLRLRMLREPRGYPAANCNLILPSNHPEAQAGYVIMEHVEYPGMSGTNTICVVTALLETGMIEMVEPV
ncbi:MAG TPA: proline racemase family protein, partial [Candidatus Limnocylindrales bacterium]